MKSWLDYWNAPNTIYVNRRHQDAHYETVLAGLKPYLPVGPDRVILDWGCGDALAAPQMATCGEVLLFDGAKNTRDRLRDRYRDHPRIRVLDEAGLQSLAPASIDLILVISVFQYLGRPQLCEALKSFRRLLRDDGILLVGDIIDPKTPMYGHVASFLRFAFRKSFLLAALRGLVVTLLSPYRQLERDAGFARFSHAEFMDILQQNGFAGERLARNVSVSELRSSYLGRKTVGTAKTIAGSAAQPECRQ